MPRHSTSRNTMDRHVNPRTLSLRLPSGSTTHCLASLLVVSICLVAAVPALAQPAATVRVSAEQASVRSTPDVEGSLVRLVSQGTLLSVVGQEGAWLRVRLPADGTEGYIHSVLVEVMTGAGASAAPVVAPRPAPAGTPPGLHLLPAEPASRLAIGFNGDGLSRLGGPSARVGMGRIFGEGQLARKDGITTMLVSAAVEIGGFAGGSISIRPHIGGGLAFWRLGDTCASLPNHPGCGGGLMEPTIFVGANVRLGQSGLVVTTRAAYLRPPVFLDYGRLGLSAGLHYYFR